MQTDDEDMACCSSDVVYQRRHNNDHTLHGDRSSNEYQSINKSISIYWHK